MRKLTPRRMALLVALLYLAGLLQWRSYMAGQIACVQSVETYGVLLGNTDALRAHLILEEERTSLDPVVWLYGSKQLDFCTAMTETPRDKFIHDATGSH